jgi:hypothetical protein
MAGSTARRTRMRGFDRSAILLSPCANPRVEARESETIDRFAARSIATAADRSAAIDAGWHWN